MTQRISCPLRIPFQPSSLPLVRAARLNTSRKNPVEHYVLIQAVTQHGDAQLFDFFHAMTEDEQDYFGLFSFDTDPPSDDFKWVIALLNSNSGDDAIEMHSGIVLPSVSNALSFHYGSGPVKKYTGQTDNDVQALVNEKMYEFRRHFNIQFDRCESFKAQKLTHEAAHHIFCLAIQKEIISGRSAFELLQLWNRPDWPYLKPRTLWSLFCLFSWSLNRLKAPVLIQRTMELYDFFNEIGRFKQKPTAWVQDRFA